MKDINYTKNYIKNLILQASATLTGLASLFIVVPFLSEDKILYGIYSVCISLTIFFNYADLGFLTAGQKYAAECYIRGERENEIKIIGFTTFLLLLFCIFIGGVLSPLAFKPNLLISEISNYSGIASKLIFILILSAPFIIFKRICSISFAIRIEQYKYYSIVLLSQLIKIFSVYLFFGENKYYLVEYFLFTQIVDVLSSLFLLFYVFSKYQYGVSFLKNIKFSKEVWNLVKKIAFVSLFTTITWLLYYEIDLVVLAKIDTPETIALYSTAFTLLSFSRNFLGIIYSSFTTRYNHYVGLGQYDKLKAFYCHNIEVLFPVVSFPIIIFAIMGSPFIISWVGLNYNDSAMFAKILILSNILAFISYPSSQYLLSTNRVKVIYIMSSLLPLVFWLGVSCSFFLVGVLSFALFKTIAQLVSVVYGFYKSCNYQSLNPCHLIGDLLKSFAIPYILIIIVAFFLLQFQVYSKGFAPMLKNILLMGLTYIIGIACSIVISDKIKTFMLNLLKSFKL